MLVSPWLLQLILSSHEYRILYPKLRKKEQWPSVQAVDRYADRRGDIVGSAIRTSWRATVAAYGGQSLYDITRSLLQRKRPNVRHKRNYKSAVSLGMVILLSRLLYAFFDRVRMGLISDRTAQKKLTGASRIVIQPFFPGLVSGSLSALALAMHPPDPRRTTLAIFAFTKSLEYTYNFLEDSGFIPIMPSVRQFGLNY